jgi:hypothetical protein
VENFFFSESQHSYVTVFGQAVESDLAFGQAGESDLAFGNNKTHQ